MIAHIATAEGAPCPTLVLAAHLLPAEDNALVDALTYARRWLCDNGAADVMKIAMVSRSAHPLYDLDYRFVQCFPGDPPRFDLRGNCGHSILASVLVASQLGWLPALAPGNRIRVNVLNNGDLVVCEVNEANRRDSTFTAHFVQDPPLDLTNSLMTGDTVTYLEYDKGVVPVSLVAVGNPYVFVDASEFAIRSTAELFADNPCLFRALAAIRRSAAELLDWDPAGAFPKIAVLGAFSSARLAVRAVSVPGWHPALALTGLSCLAAATAIAGTVPHRLAAATGCRPGHLVADTPGGTFRAAVRVEDQATAGVIAWVSIFDKAVRFTGDVLLADDDLAGLAWASGRGAVPAGAY